MLSATLAQLPGCCAVIGAAFTPQVRQQPDLRMLSFSLYLHLVSDPPRAAGWGGFGRR